MFGGWTAAVLLQAVVASTEGDAQPSASTVNFLRPVRWVVTSVIAPERLGGGRSLEHWRADLHAADGELLATSLIVLTNRRDIGAAPAVRDAGGTGTRRAGARSTRPVRRVSRPRSGRCRASGGAATRADASGCGTRRVVPLDHLQLAYLADQYAPAVVLLG